MALEIVSTYLSLNTTGNADVIDITRQVSETVNEAGIRDGQVLVFDARFNGGCYNHRI